MRDFYFNGVPASEFGIRIGGVNTYGAPARIVTEYSIPGKNGSFIVDEARFGTFPRSYDCALYNVDDLEEMTSAIKAWLLADGQYHRLEDSYAPDVYRMARIDGEIRPVLAGSSGRNAKFTLNFSCQPQKWLKEGERALIIDDTGRILYNPTVFETYPLLKITTDNDCSIVFQHISDDGISHDDYCTVVISGLFGERTIILDCESTEAWFEDDGLSANAFVSITGDPILHAKKGQEADFVILDTGTADIELMPRWWRV